MSENLYLYVNLYGSQLNSIGSMEMNKEKIDTFLMLIKHEMFAEQLETINREFIKQIVLRAGGKVSDVDHVLEHSTVKEIDEDLFYIKISTS